MPKKLFEKRPEIASQWDFSVNGENDFYNINAWSKDVSYGWICAKNHSWRATAYTRSSGENCIACLRALGPLTLNSYDFMVEWGNGNGLPEGYTHLSLDIVQWNCISCGNNWNSMIYSRIKGAASCPYCSGKELSEVDFSMIVELLSSSFSKGNNCSLSDLGERWKKDKVLWDCEHENHSYEMTIEKKLESKKCPYCANRRLLVGFNDLPSALPEVYSEWSPKNTLDPQSLLVSSRETVLWICSRRHCRREWITSVEHRRDGSGCPSCSNSRPKRVLLEDSIAGANRINRYWNYSANSHSPEAIGKGSHKLISLVCSLGHKWTQSARSAFSKDSELCPYCRGSILLKGFNDLQTLYPEISAQWHPTKNGSNIPSDFLSNAYHRVWWNCDNGHNFSRLISYRTQYYSDCTYCLGGKSKLEIEVADFLVAEFPQLEIVCGDKTLLGTQEIDIFLPEIGIAIEVNGEYWHSDEMLSRSGGAESYHSNKVELAATKGVKLGFLWEDDWLSDRELAKTALRDFISEGKKSKSLRRLNSIRDFDLKIEG